MGYTLLHDAEAVVTMEDDRPVRTGVDVLLREREVAALGPPAEVAAALPPGAPVERLDCRGLLVTPGFVNTHHHLYQTFQRNVPFVQDAKLFDWLVGLYEIWRELTPEAVEVSATVGLAELVLSGCTTVADHFYVFPRGQPADLLDYTIAAARRVGVRFHPSRGSMSRGRSAGGLPPDEVVQREDQILADSERVIAAYHDPARLSMCRVSLAPCSPFSVTDGALREAAQLARRQPGVRLHTHLAETRDEDDYCRQTLGQRPLDYMEANGWLGPDVWYAHGIHFSDDELRRMAAAGTGVAHCPGSNLRLGSGIAKVPTMLRLDVPVGLAVDGSASNDSSNMLREVQLAMLVHRVGTDVAAMPALSALRLATVGGARLLGRDDIGRLAPGMAADLALWDLHHIGFAGAWHDPVAALVFCTGAMWARHVFVDGRRVVVDGRLTTVELDALFDRAHGLSTAMRQRAQARTGVDYLRHRTAT